MVGKLTLKNLVAHKFRLALALFAVLLGTSFVSASFIVSDGLNDTFNGLFTQISKGIDTQVRTKAVFGDQGQAQRDPVPASVLDTVRKVDGVELANGTLFRTVPLLDKNGKAIKTQGAPTSAIDFGGETVLSGTKLLTGTAPKGDAQAVLDGATADRYKFKVGDQITAVLDAGKRSFTITGLIGQGDQRGFAGAVILGLDPAVTATVLNTGNTFDSIDLHAAKGVSQEELTKRVQAVLPANLESVTGKTVVKESTDAIGKITGIIGKGLLGFAVVALFVSAFVIANTFRIIIGQRIRELALLRAVGANSGQIRAMVMTESFGVGAVASVLGIGLGALVAKGLVAAFNAAGGGFPDSATIIKPRTIIAALVVGVGVTLLSSIVPAWRASRIPPVAAMRPESGFASLESRKRVVLGAIITVLGIALLGLGLFVKHSSAAGTLVPSGFGALLLFLGVASLSATVARTASLALGKPLTFLPAIANRLVPLANRVLRFRGAGQFRPATTLSGELARQNAARAPRRTASTASALMIGVALASTGAVLAQSLKATFDKTFRNAVRADYFVSDQSFQGFSPEVAKALGTIPELGAVSALRFSEMQVNGDGKAVAAVDPSTIAKLINFDVTQGDIADITDGIAVQVDPVRDLKLKLGDTIDVSWQNGRHSNLPVKAIFKDNSVGGANWIVSLKTIEASSITAQPRDQFVAAKLKEGADPTAARAAIDKLTATYPQVRIEDQGQFRKRQTAQIDQLQTIIFVMLFLSAIIALLGIVNTLALSVFERTRELGMLRAVGMGRRQLRRIIRWEAVIVAVFGGVLGIVIGTPLGAAISSAMPKSFISTVAIPWGTLVVMLVLAMFAGLLAAVLPAWRAGRMNVLAAIASE